MSLSPQKFGDYYARGSIRLGHVGSPDGPQSQREMLEHYFDLQQGRLRAGPPQMAGSQVSGRRFNLKGEIV